MCGITGFVARSTARPAEALAAIVQAQASAIAHRGPDDKGVWVDAACGVALGHRRLSIVDLSPAGHQPMSSHDGRYVIMLNGEIYNYRELRCDIEQADASKTGFSGWRGHSDTEVLLELMAASNVAAALERTVGMFAIAVWDRLERSLTLARDRLGEKPLYYGFVADAFVFGSELKALRAYPGWNADVDREALTAYLRFAYVPHTHSIYRGIHKLPPGTFLTVGLDAVAARTLPRPQTYWSASNAVGAARQDPFRGSYGEAVDELERLLRQS